MASVNDTTTPTPAQEHLNFALGKTRVKLQDLSPAEFDELLKSTLADVYLKELRGFKPLADIMSRGLISSNAHFVLSYAMKADYQEQLHTQTLELSSGLFGRVLTYKRHETGETTSDMDTKAKWSNSAYLFSGRGQVIVVQRPVKYSYAVDNLLVVSLEFEKIPLQDNQFTVQTLNIKPLPIERFREEFGSSYPLAAHKLFDSLAMTYRQTTDELRSQYEAMTKRSAGFTRLRSSISYY